MIWRVRDRATFLELAGRARRGADGPVRVRYVPAPAEPARVAFAIGRPVGSAVTRNRARRRLREAARALAAAGDLPGGAYLVGLQPAGAALSYHDLHDHVSRAVQRAARTAIPTSSSTVTP